MAKFSVVVSLRNISACEASSSQRMRRRREGRTHLRVGYSEGIPEEGRVRKEDFDDPSTQNDGSEFGVPDLLLLLERRSVTEVVRLLLESTNPESDLRESQRPTRITSKIKGRGEGLVVRSPELVRVRGEEGRDLGVEEVSEIGVHSVTEHLATSRISSARIASNAVSTHLPEVLVRESSNRSELEFEKMTLSGIHIDGVNSFDLSGDGVVQGVVSTVRETVRKVSTNSKERLAR